MIVPTIVRVVMLAIVIALTIAGLLTPQIKNEGLSAELNLALKSKVGAVEIARDDLTCDELKTRVTAAFALNVTCIICFGISIALSFVVCLTELAPLSAVMGCFDCIGSVLLLTTWALMVNLHLAYEPCGTKYNSDAGWEYGPGCILNIVAWCVLSVMNCIVCGITIATR